MGQDASRGAINAIHDAAIAECEQIAGGSDNRAVGAVTDQSASNAGSSGCGSPTRAAGSHSFSAGGMRCAVPSSVETPAVGLGLPAAAGLRSPRRAAIVAAVAAEPHRSLQSFGDQFGVTRERIRAVLKKEGFKKPGAWRGPKPSLAVAERNARRAAGVAERKDSRRETDAQALVLHEQGHSFSQIGRAFNITAMSAFRRVRRAQARAQVQA